MPEIIIFEPIGKAKPSRAQYWREKAVGLRRLVYVVGATAFVAGAICGAFIVTAI